MKRGPAVAERVTARTDLDVEAVRRQFPILQTRVRGKPLVYLDNAATSQKPQVVIDAITRFYESENANIHRGVYYLSERATEAYEAARVRIQRSLNARESQEIVFVRGTTEAINLVAYSFVRPMLAPGDEILISAMEHHSNIVPWQLVAGERGARIRVIPMNDRGELILEEYEALIGPRTRIVSIGHISNALGTVNAVQQIVKLAHARGVPVLVDGAQGVPHGPVDVQGIGCDFYAFSGHKAFGPTGIGVLYGRADRLEAMQPFQGGGDMIRSVTFERTEYADPPARFEAGTPHISGAIGLAAALDFVEGIGWDFITPHEADLLQYASDALVAIPGVRLVGTARHKASVISFVLEGVHPHDLGTIVDQQGVAIRAGHHCAQPVMARFGIPATARASLAFYNNRQDVDALAAAVGQARKVFG